jgi:ABC-type lipoprotein export system ATPase subunit
LSDPAALHLTGVRKVLGRTAESTVTFALGDLAVAQGEQVALTGPSGCGKSTLLNIVSGLVRPDAGSVVVAGQDLGALSTAGLDGFRGRNIGFVHQTFNLLDPLDALENVLVGMRFGRAVARGDRRRRAAELLGRVGLAHRSHARPARLSVGERQRVAIARALANHPRLLLADEPTGALDPATAESVFALLLEETVREGCTLLLVTHDHDLAARLPRRVECHDFVRHEVTGGRPS